ncbi:RagB/SusD family nutrient uptake outer membrane protein [Sinomicrobium weinanense]|uniref:RagB/SusD family nutrient uptake outer membrane protein n=1 Tax=Sinomicrobium weinanense TaxID=2842200 RepID=A0A926Q2Z2_9FLAO|nr:RagB/SusD family nutrient uptake outer membrane protein [Sinomicrobium weinanense]MBC9797122.1 RagB/SusD family nutrient uptake outer membrane protein [Sinomicrobium weinanense]MBU3124823.1 RagB/SusD family nutrient uptake outer membrane protein [Sinomicrobium weinanense]
MKRTKHILLIVSVLILGGCELTEVDTISDITNDQYWSSQGDVESYLFGIYNKFRDTQNSTYYFEDRGDTFVPGLEAGLSTAWNQNLSPQNAPNWLTFYNLIHHCNLLLKHSADIEFQKAEDRNQIVAETYFIRAFTYFTLLKSWGDAPLELEPTESASKPQLPRAPKNEVMAQVLSDIDMALELFPGDGLVSKSRASRAAAHALRADVLLWKAKVLGGSDADLEAVIASVDAASAGVSLEQDFAKIYDTENKNGPEVIFSLHFDFEEKSGNEGDDLSHYSKNLKPRDIFVQDAVNFDDIPYARSGARSGYAPSPKLEAAFDENPDDIRKDISIIEAIAEDNSVIGVFDNKMRGTVVTENREYDSDIIVYRLAEMILFRAEALAALNRTGEAVAELNKIRNRAQIGNYNGDMGKNTVEYEILKERFRELYLELKRWPDLLRFHYAGTIDVYSEVPNLSGTNVPLYFPIPVVQIDRNPNLKQTEGYE